MSLRATLESIIRKIVSELPHMQLYPCTVESQHADYTVDVTPDDDVVRGLGGTSNVPIKHGIPGVRVTVPAGARVLLGFVSGDGQNPYVSLWDEGSVDTIEFAGGTRAIARVGDLVQVNWPLLSAVGTLNGLPFAASLAIASVSTGTISSGSDKVSSG